MKSVYRNQRFPSGASGRELFLPMTDVSLIPGAGRSLKEGTAAHSIDNCLERSHGQGAGLRLWSHSVAKSWTYLKQLRMHACCLCIY